MEIIGFSFYLISLEQCWLRRFDGTSDKNEKTLSVVKISFIHPAVLVGLKNMISIGSEIYLIILATAQVLFTHP